MSHPALSSALPSEAEAGVAKETSRLLASRLKKGAPMQLRILDDDATQATVKLPAPAVALLLRILEEMARGNAVTIMPVHSELTTQEAADMLGLTRKTVYWHVWHVHQKLGTNSVLQARRRLKELGLLDRVMGETQKEPAAK